MTKVLTALSTSLDGFIAGAGDTREQPLGVGGDRLFTWFFDGDTPNGTRRRAWGMLFPSRRRVSTVTPRAFELYG
jgi:hypothetical protein